MVPIEILSLDSEQRPLSLFDPLITEVTRARSAPHWLQSRPVGVGWGARSFLNVAACEWSPGPGRGRIGQA